jgi:molybdopterin biosynthesis enzyme
MAKPVDVTCSTCGAVPGEDCVVVRLIEREQREVVLHPIRRLPGSPHMVRRMRAKLQDEGE